MRFFLVLYLWRRNSATQQCHKPRIKLGPLFHYTINLHGLIAPNGSAKAQRVLGAAA